MQIKWIPVKNDNKSIYYEKINDNKIQVNDDVVDFSDTTVLEYDIPEELKPFIKKAYREQDGGELYLLLLRYYSTEEKRIWEEFGYYYEGENLLRGTRFETYTENGELK